MKPIARHMNAAGTAIAMLTATAILWSLWLIADTPSYRRRIAQQQRLDSSLETLEREAATQEALIRPFVESGSGGDINRLLQDLFGPADAGRFHLETTSPALQYRLLTVTVDDADAVFAPLTTRIQAAEALRPPLKLVGCILETAPGKTAQGRVRLTFERIEWQPGENNHGGQ